MTKLGSRYRMPAAKLRVQLAAVLLAATAATPASAEWWEARTNHFVLVSEGTEKDAKAMALKLERFDNALRSVQNMPINEAVPETAKVFVFRFGTMRDIGALVGSRSVAGFYMARAAKPVAFTPAREEDTAGSMHIQDSRGSMGASTVLQHEYTHHFMLKNFSAAYPGWYVEGFAELNSTLELRDDGSFIIGKPASHRSAELFSMLQLPVKKLLDPDFKYEEIEDVLQKYSLGWLLVHYLTFNPQRSGQLAEFLKAVGAGEAPLAASKRIFGDLDKLNSELQRYKTSRLAAMSVSPVDRTMPTVTMRKLPENEERYIRQRIRESVGVTRKQARELAPKLSSAAAAETGNLFLQLLAAEACLDARDYAGAIANADRALAIDPKSVEAMVFKARALFEPADGAATRFTDARKLLIKAHQIDPDDARPLIDFYTSWRKSGQPIPAAALNALDAAFPLALQDQEYRMILTRQLLEDNRIPQAKQVITPLAYSFDGDNPEKNVPGKILERINANDTAGALAKLKEYFDKREKDEPDSVVSPG